MQASKAARKIKIKFKMTDLQMKIAKELAFNSPKNDFCLNSSVLQRSNKLYELSSSRDA